MRFAAILLALSTLLPAAQAVDVPMSEAVAIERVRTLVLQGDGRAAYFEGRRLALTYRDSLALRAWMIRGLALSDEDSESAMRMADDMVRAAPENGWSWFAEASALLNFEDQTREALDAAKHATDADPTNPDFLGMVVSALMASGESKNAADLLDAHEDLMNASAPLLVARGRAILYSTDSRHAFTPSEEHRIPEALQYFARSRTVDPSYVRGWTEEGSYYARARRAMEAIPLLNRGIELAPQVIDPHYDYWRAVKGNPAAGPDETRAAIEADMDRLRCASDTPAAWLAIATGYERYVADSEEAKRYEERILAVDPNGPEAEWVHVRRLRAMRAEIGEKPDGAASARYVSKLRQFINRPFHFNEALLGEAYMNLFFRLQEEAGGTDDELLDAVKGMALHEKTNIHISLVDGAIALAERRIAFPYAERLVDQARAAFAKRSRDASPEEVSDYEGMLADASGFVALREGKLDDAGTQLKRAVELIPQNPETHHHLGMYYEARGDIEGARRAYERGVVVPTPQENPNLAALEGIYAEAHGSHHGFDAYVERLRLGDAGVRKTKILSTRNRNAAKLPDFNFKKLGGGAMSSSALRGRVAVINLWGIWCAWCVRELPEYQKLYLRYKDDPDIAILSINNDGDAQKVRKWMVEKGFTFPVLLDEGYLRQRAITAFPTTWFLDREGRLAFEQTGWSEHLAEEFTWRIEALR